MISTNIWHRRLHGSMYFELLDASCDPRLRQLFRSRSRMHWQPPYQITRLPSWFQLALDCYEDSAGLRRFTLVERAEDASLGVRNISTARGLSLVAAVGGYHLLVDRGEIEVDLLLTHDEARLFLQYVEHRREYLGPRKQMCKALGVCAAGRVDKSMKSVLPDDLGLDKSGRGEAWTIGRLRDEGVQGAHDAGIEAPGPEQILSYGLTEAARLNPLYLETPVEAAAMVRMSLFALPESGVSITDEQLRYVAGQVRSSLLDHLSDSDEQFNKWLEDPDSNLLRRISKRKDCPMTHRQVKIALIELGWRSLQMLGKCIDAQMRSFKEVMPIPLSSVEDSYFALSFLASPSYGDLPLILLHDRFADLSAAIINVWNNFGDRDSIGVLHRVMSYYAVLIGNRRAADRTYKRRAAGRNVSGNTTIEVDLVTAREDGSIVEGVFVDSSAASKGAAANGAANKSGNQRQELFSESVLRIAKLAGYDCSFQYYEWQAILISDDDKVLRIGLCCPDVDLDEELTVSRAAFEAVVKDVSSED